MRNTKKAVKVRRSWGPLKPVTRIKESGKRYTRKKLLKLLGCENEKDYGPMLYTDE